LAEETGINFDKIMKEKNKFNEWRKLIINDVSITNTIAVFLIALSNFGVTEHGRQ
jgi:hypothetical protein